MMAIERVGTAETGDRLMDGQNGISLVAARDISKIHLVMVNGQTWGRKMAFLAVVWDVKWTGSEPLQVRYEVVSASETGV